MMVETRQLGDKKLAIISACGLVAVLIWHVLIIQFDDPTYDGGVRLFGYVLTSTTPIWLFIMLRKMDT